MKRRMLERLVEWKDRRERMPLVLHGARQVGKTCLLEQFGRDCFADTVYVNFETDAAIAADFSGDIDPVRILNTLEAYFRRKIDPESTLIIFDEIQACGRALTSLKYFCEKAPEYHIVAAGSLPGISVHRETNSFPVGKVEFLTLFPMDFQEFLAAAGEESLKESIRASFETDTPLPESLHVKALELYRTFLVVGGMPGAVNAYLRERRVMDAQAVQHLILSSYVADMAKYASPSGMTRIRACFDSIPAQLAKKNRKFHYKVVRKGGSATRFGSSIDWLAAAGIVAKCGRIEHGCMPPEAYRDPAAFKLYMGDVGLLASKSGMNVHTLLSAQEESAFSGAVAENYVAASLVANGHTLYYWESGSQAEINFVIQTGSGLVPVEVKSGLNTRSRSLSVYRERYKPPYAIRVSQKQSGFENGIKAVPLYAAFCIGPHSGGMQ